MSERDHLCSEPRDCPICQRNGATHPLAAAVLQQEAGEPVAEMVVTRVFTEYENSEKEDTVGAPHSFCLMHAASLKLPEGRYPLYTTPQPSPPQARVPLTGDQVDALLHTKHFDKSYKLHASDKVCIDWYRLGLRDGERAHLIGLETKGDGNG